jgi:cell fate regulator YaaT (PSP1 superfamily)
VTENNQVQKPKQDKNKKYILVRYGLINLMGWFEHHEKHISKKPTRVIVKTDRGLELGCIVGNLTGYKAGHFKMTKEQLQEYYEDSEIEFQDKPVGRLLRIADEEDINEEKHLRQIVKEEIQCCEKYVEELKLPMKIISAEHIFGGERVIFYFMSESRIDFRELVKKIAHEYQTRIEMRQIGARDEAKLLGDYETCGQQCCCQKFLKVLKPVNMRMAKMQKATLDPSKISGYCGRLKCCLRYEDQKYTQLKQNLPRKNVCVKTPCGKGKVIDTQILTQLVMVMHDNGEKSAIPLEDIEIITAEEAAAENGNGKQQNNKAGKPSNEKIPENNKETDLSKNNGNGKEIKDFSN